MKLTETLTSQIIYNYWKLKLIVPIDLYYHFIKVYWCKKYCFLSTLNMSLVQKMQTSSIHLTKILGKHKNEQCHPSLRNRSIWLTIIF